MATVVMFGENEATEVTYNSANEVVATTPAGTAGTVDVTVTTSGGSATLTDGFEYAGAEVMTASTGKRRR